MSPGVKVPFLVISSLFSSVFSGIEEGLFVSLNLPSVIPGFNKVDVSIGNFSLKGSCTVSPVGDMNIVKGSGTSVVLGNPIF